MSLIEWKPEFSVGNAAVDHEHRELIDLINQRARRPFATARTGTGSPPVSAKSMRRSRRISRSRRRSCATPATQDIGPHKQDHESLLDQLADIIDGVEIGNALDEA